MLGDGYLSHEFRAVGLPFVAVREDDPVDTLVYGVLARLVQMRFLELEADLLHLDDENLLVFGSHHEIRIARSYHLLAGEVLVLIPTEKVRQHVGYDLAGVCLFVILAKPPFNDARHAPQSSLDAVFRLVLVNSHRYPLSSHHRRIA